MFDTHYTCAIVSVSLSDVVASIEWVSNSDGVASLGWVQIIDVVVAIVLVANSDVVALFEWVQLIDVVVAIVCVCVPIIVVVVSQQLVQVNDVVSSLRPLSIHNRELCHRCSRRTRCAQSAGVRCARIRIQL